MKRLGDLLQHFFIPRESNNFRSKLLHVETLTVYLVFALVFTIGVQHFSANKGSVLGFATDITTEKLFQLTNQEREKQGLPDLHYNDKLAAAANKKAENMFAENYWNHYGPKGETPWQFILGAGYQYEYAGENLAKNFMFSNAVVDAWMNSPTHRENILRKEYTEVGFAIMNGNLNGEDTTLVVQMFGKPLTPSLSQDTQNTAPQAAPQVAPDQNIEVKAPQNNSVLAKNDIVENKQPAPQVNLMPFYFNVNIIFFIILGIALVFDLYFASKLKIVRAAGKNMAHFIFIGFILLGVFIFIKGSII